MPPDIRDVKLTALEFCDLLHRCELTNDPDSPVVDEAWECAKRLYRMLRHVPGIHNDGDAPERQN